MAKVTISKLFNSGLRCGETVEPLMLMLLMSNRARMLARRLCLQGSMSSLGQEGLETCFGLFFVARQESVGDA